MSNRDVETHIRFKLEKEAIREHLQNVIKNIPQETVTQKLDCAEAKVRTGFTRPHEGQPCLQVGSSESGEFQTVTQRQVWRRTIPLSVEDKKSQEEFCQPLHDVVGDLCA